MSNHKDIPFNKNFIHHNQGGLVTYMREIVFGMQDGMVSTLGAITGIAIGSLDHFTVILAGVAIIAVESISMSIGAYTSTLSEKNIAKRMLYEESTEIESYPEAEREELEGMYVKDGWPKQIAEDMAQVAFENPTIMLQEMAYRELSIAPKDDANPILNGVSMFFAYIIGGLIPLMSYFFLPVQNAIVLSIPVTLVGLFILGSFTTRFTKQNWLKSGLHMLLLAGVALIVGFLVGHFAELFIK